jgi:hypothetical protein
MRMVVSSKGIALIELCLMTFDLGRARTGIWPSLFLSEWCRLMMVIATNFTDDKARRAVDNISWLLDKLNQFELRETPGLALFAPFQSAFYSALLSSTHCTNTCGRVGNFGTSLYSRFFLAFEKVKLQVVQRITKPLVESTWKGGGQSILKKNDSIQVSSNCSMYCCCSFISHPILRLTASCLICRW